MTNEQMLTEAIRKSGLKESWLAERLGISVSTLYNKKKGISEFTASEIQRLKWILMLSDEERDEIFFSTHGREGGDQ